MATDSSRWVVIYPVYLDETKTVSEGRRIGKESCAVRPSAKEILEVVTKEGKFAAEVEYKKYSRDFSMVGRVRVDLATGGAPFVTTRKELFKFVGSHLKNNMNRKIPSNHEEQYNMPNPNPPQQRAQPQQQQQQQQQQQRSSSSSNKDSKSKPPPSSSSSSSNASGFLPPQQSSNPNNNSNKKKNKKKKKK
jgi:signal recognition particle subunit SEC65